MNTRVKLLILLVLVCLVTSAAMAQKKALRKARKATSTTGCKAASVPKGMVVVGYTSGPCRTAVVKRAENGVAMCAGQPIPEGFKVFAQGMGAVANTCPGSSFVLYDKTTVSGFYTPEEIEKGMLESKCNAEVERDIANSVSHNQSEAASVASASFTRYKCMKKRGQ